MRIRLEKRVRPTRQCESFGESSSALYVVLYLSNAMAPEASPDGAGYHLGLVARYLREHGFVRITDNLYAAMPAGVEMLFLFAFAFGRHSAAALVHFAFLAALVWQVFSYGRRSGFPVAGACAALLVFASPVVGIDGTSAYNDVAVAAIAFTLFYLLQVWDEDRTWRLAAAIGLVAGFAFAAKYTAWPAVIYAAGFVLLKDRKAVFPVVVCAAAAIAPWLLKNWIYFHNPVAPFFNRQFPNPFVMAGFEDTYRRLLAMYHLKSRWQIPMEVTTYGSLSGLLGPVFLLAPLGLIALRRREGRQLWFAALVFGANYFSNISARFLIPPLPFVALAMMLALQRRAATGSHTWRRCRQSSPGRRLCRATPIPMRGAWPQFRGARRCASVPKVLTWNGISRTTVSTA